MKIKYKTNKWFPDIQYVAIMENIPMAQIHYFTDDMPSQPIQVTKKRLEKAGITKTIEKEIEIGFIQLLFYIDVGYTLKDIIKINSGDGFPFEIELIK
jgi:hypothetical protein